MSSVAPEIDETTGIAGYVSVRVHDSAVTRYRVPWWDALTPAEKAQETEHLSPVATAEQANTTCIGLHQLLVDSLDASQPITGVVEQLALGRSETAPSENDTALNDEVDRVDVTEFTDEGDALDVRTFVGEGDANVDTAAGETISEVGLYAGDGSYFLNHSLLANPIPKDNSRTMTVSVTLIFTSQ